MKGVIIAGGSIKGDIKKYIGKETLVVCADSGYIYAKEHNIFVNALIGDFDSMKMPENADCEIIKYPVCKDATDTQLCIDYIESKGIKDVILFGALGGKRADHSIANIQLLEYASDKKISMKIVDNLTEIFLLDSSKINIKGNKGDIISVFALDTAEGISYKGLKYKLNGASLSRSITYCISNSFAENEAEIEVKRGKLIIVHLRGE